MMKSGDLLKSMVIISYGTKTPVRYAEAARRFRWEIRSLGMECEIDIVPSLGGRKENTLRKPSFILEKLNKNVLWLDADSKVVESFSLDFDFDVGYVEIERKGENIISAAVAVKNSSGGRTFLKRWIYLCSKEMRVFDHARMLMAMKENVRYKNITPDLKGKVIINANTQREICI